MKCLLGLVGFLFCLLNWAITLWAGVELLLARQFFTACLPLVAAVGWGWAASEIVRKWL